MKISYILQIKDLCIVLVFGFIIGILYNISNSHNNIKKILAIQIISDIVFTLIFSGTFLLLINILNQGEIRLFLLCGYLLGFSIEKITLGKLFAKSFKCVYNLIIKGLKSLYKSRLGRIIFK
jgi:hypothetical protein